MATHPNHSPETITMFKEWVVITVVIGFLLSILIISKFSEVKHTQLLINEKKIENQQVLIKLSGAVKKPGIYSCAPGINLKELLEHAEMLPSADRKKVHFKKVIYSSQAIDIPQKNGIVFKTKKISLEEK